MTKPGKDTENKKEGGKNTTILQIILSSLMTINLAVGGYLIGRLDRIENKVDIVVVDSISNKQDIKSLQNQSQYFFNEVAPNYAKKSWVLENFKEK